jgi:large subunit ribosomal protein L25
MASQFTLDPIEANTKGQVKRLRKAGFIPVSLQHKGVPTLHFQQEARPLDEFIRRYGDAALIDLWVAPGHQRQRAIVHNVQRDPLTERLLQVTYQHLRREDTLKTHVSLVFAGEPLAVHLGEAIVQHQLDRLDIECDQDNLPDQISANIADLLAGDVLRVSDLPDNPRYKILNPPDTVLASLTNTRAGRGEEETTEAPLDTE